jgi:virulence-associated protein VapD
MAGDIVSINTYMIDNSGLPVFNCPMQMTRLGPMRLTRDYRQLQRQLAHIGYLSQGSVFERAPGQQGSPYVWTRKVHAKTITVALSQEQYQWLRQAVLNQRQLEKIVARMQTLSRQVLFETVPGVVRRKRLGKRVLGLI